MKDAWYIYKGSGQLGPFTAEAVRQGLREGTIDPFDMVGRDGSSLRREIVEVDELFLTQEPAFDEQDATTVRHPQGHGIEASSFGDVVFHDRNQDFSEITQPNQRPGNAGIPPIGGGPLHLAADPQTTVRIADAKSPPRDQSPRRQRTPKHYYVTDAGARMLGPLSLEEIRSLFYRGVLPQGARVMREGSSAQVPVSKFLAVFSNGQRGPAELGAHPRLTRSLTTLPKANTANETPISPLAAIGVVIALLLLGAAGRLAWESKHPLKSLSPPTSLNSHPTPTRRAPRSSTRRTKTPSFNATMSDTGRVDGDAQSSDLTEDASTEGPIEPTPIPAPPIPAPLAFRDELDIDEQATHPTNPSSNRRHNEPRPSLERVNRKSPRVSRPKIARSRPASIATEVARPSVRNPTISTKLRPRLAAIPTSTPTALPTPSTASAPTPAPTKAAASPASRGIGSLVDGTQVRNFGPLSFDRNALSQCQAACTITFNSSDGSIRGVFFKKIWGPALERSSGSVYVSGSVRKADGGTKIILIRRPIISRSTLAFPT